MSPKYLLILLLAFAVACNNTDSQSTAVTDDTEITGAGNDNGTDNSTTSSTSKPSKTKKPANNNWEKLSMFAFKDNKGQVIAQAPYPSGWKMMPARQNEPSITGPNGVKIMDQPFKSYIYTNDYQMQQIYMQSGQALRLWQGTDALVKNDFIPELQNQGWSFIRSYNIPEVAKVDKWYSDQLYKAMPSQTEIIALGTEWKKDDGTMAFMISHIQVSNTSDLQTWYYYSSVLKADKAYFAKSVKQYIFSMANTRYNIEPIMEYNKAEAQRVGQSWASFNKRMAQNQANFEQQQRNHVNNSNAINDAIMNGYNASNASSDKQHQNFIDGIREEDNATNTNTGSNYKTSIHYNDYWMNSSGDYISTNQSDYNPNLDDDLNGSNWDKLKKRD